MPLYATLQQYRDWSDDQDTVLSARDLELASDIVAEATVGAVYVVDSLTGLPTTTTVLEAMRAATLWVLDALAVSTAAGELEGVEEATIGSVRYKLKAGTATEPVTGLPVNAHRKLFLAGLVGQPVQSYG